MHVLITGGTGFIGSHLVKVLLSRGDTVTVLTRDKARAASKLDKSVECVQMLEAMAKSPDAIVNLAGARLDGKRWTEKYKEILIQSRLNITKQLIEYLRKTHQKPKVLISGSAIGYYGPQGDMPLREDSKPNLCFTHDLCRLWEQNALEAEKEGVRVCLLRTGIVNNKVSLNIKEGILKSSW